MSILTRVNGIYDEDAGVHRIAAVTKFDINNRSSLNRVAARVAVMTGVSQRALVAAALDDVDVNMSWRSPAGLIDPKDKFPEAKEIDFSKHKIYEADPIASLLPTYLREYIQFEEYKNPHEPGKSPQMLYMWEIPLDMD